MRIAWVAAMVGLAWLAGCAAEPFQRAALPVLDHPDPGVIRESFARSLPGGFISDDTVVIEAPFHDDMAILSVLRVDRAAGTFELLGLNHVGIKLFELGSGPQGPTIQFAAPPLMKQKEVLLSIARNTRLMYFDMTPSDRAQVDVRATCVRFSQDTPQGKLVYEFGGQPAVLLEKRMKGLLGTLWRVRYYDYAQVAGGPASGASGASGDSGGLYPRGIVMDNGKYHYRIIVKNREWLAH